MPGMRVIDANLQLIACGSSGTFMPTYLTWDREVLEECYDKVDGISLHAYYGNTAEWSGNSTARFLAMNLDMDRHIHEIAAVCDYVQALQRSSKRLWLSFDEWNVWYRARSGQFTNGRRTAAPHLLEEVYNLEDALLVGGFVNTLLRNSDRVRVACLAQLVNVIGAIRAEPSGPAWRQTTFHPFAAVSGSAGHTVLATQLEGDDADSVLCTVTRGSDEVRVYLAHRSLDVSVQLDIDLATLGVTGVVSAELLWHPDPYATNTADDPDRVAPRPLDTTLDAGRLTVTMPPVSWASIRLSSRPNRG